MFLPTATALPGGDTEILSKKQPNTSREALALHEQPVPGALHPELGCWLCFHLSVPLHSHPGDPIPKNPEGIAIPDNPGGQTLLEAAQ